MKLKRSFQIALNIILHSRVRSWLTVLGIVIGIAALVSIISVSQGAQRTLTQNLNSLNADILSVSSGFSRAIGAGSGFRGGGGFGEGGFGGGPSSGVAPKNLTVRDVTLLRSIPNVDKVMGTISGSLDVTYLGKTSRLSVQGVDPAIWKDFDTTDFASGRTLAQGDTNVVILGGRIATTTFTGVEVNREISIGGQMFKIEGILKETGGSDDSRIFMPIKNAVDILEGKTTKNFDSISIKIKDISITDDTVTQITSKLMISHGIIQSNKQDFSVTSAKAIQQRVSSTLSSMSIFLGAIAAISLIVGAIGIMNTMFTSVLERTREIGILKAIGAKNRDILAIFLMNSGLLGLIGGIFGVLLGIVGSSFISSLAGIASVGRFSLTSAYISPALLIEAFVVAVGVGLIAGAIPAYRASRLKPVDALRYE